MRLSGRNSSFQSVVLEIVQGKLNCMMTECFQLKKAVDFNNHEKLTKLVLREIAQDAIHSVHMTKEDARKAIALIDEMESQKVINDGRLDDHLERRRLEQMNPFADSPFI
jgi:hypothetical protein